MGNGDLGWLQKAPNVVSLCLRLRSPGEWGREHSRCEEPKVGAGLEFFEKWTGDKVASKWFGSTARDRAHVHSSVSCV
jgi:hypothetical protein